MRTMYAIIYTDLAVESGIDLSTHQLVDEKRVIITQSEAAGMKDVKLLTKQEVLVCINNAKKE